MKQQKIRFAFSSSGSNCFAFAVCFSLIVSLFAKQTCAQTETLSGVRPTAAAVEQIDQTASAERTVAALVEPNVETLVHYGDVLEIDVLGSIEFDWRGKLSDEGLLSGLPNLTAPISGLCRTETEIADKIAAAYKDILRQPEVVVRTLDRSTREHAVLFGAVRAPQRFQIERSVRLNELLVIAGGITDRASGEITIFRPANVSCAAVGKIVAESNTLKLKLTDLIEGKSESNPFVQSGDTITIEEAAPVYVIGGVAAPQRVLFRAGLTAARAVASAGGLNQTADGDKIFVFRRQKNRADLKIIELNYKKALKNAANDVALEPYDVVEAAQTGRAAGNRPPIVAALDSALPNTAQLPLRIIK